MSFPIRVTYTCPWGTSSTTLALTERPHLGELIAAAEEAFQIEGNKKSGQWGMISFRVRKLYIESSNGSWNEVVSSSQLSRHCHLYGSKGDGDFPASRDDGIRCQFSPTTTRRLHSGSPMSPKSIQMDEHLNDSYKLSLGIDEHRAATRDETRRYLIDNDISPARQHRAYHNSVGR
eukprot:TRINITY_DN28181_c0_g1_i1.p1 TRINITY_DN28181_c0_g1~~TRINITY_DN28181_c0_g1_i1.p1  ORF type:complete len:187 (+),score=27.53 TRINITY_DN28181_c0_g1_i1:35-562(+)